MTKKEEFIQFIEDNKELFFKFLVQTQKDLFPFVCTPSSEVLFSYIYDKFPEAKCLLGDFTTNWKWCESYDEFEDNALHCWIKYEDIIVDFTLFQFSDKWEEGMDDEENDAIIKDWLNNEISFQHMYHILVKPYQESFIITQKDINFCWFSPYESLKPRFHQIAKNRTFEEYLNILSEFKDGNYSTDKKRELNQLEQFANYNYENRKILSKNKF